jgi:hypothetical protein
MRFSRSNAICSEPPTTRSAPTAARPADPTGPPSVGEHRARRFTEREARDHSGGCSKTSD